MFIGEQELCSTEPIIISFPMTICKAAAGEERLFTIEASNEKEDAEGDIIARGALFDAAPSFIEKGHVDMDHMSELARNPAYAFLRISDPEAYVIGYPLDVFDMGNGRTGIKAKVKKNKDGTVDPNKYKWDEFWCSLTAARPTTWYASIYGFPKAVEKGTLAKRFFVKALDWKSIAVTRRPVNESLIGIATPVAKANVPSIVLAKSYAAAVALNRGSEVLGLQDFSRESLMREFETHIKKDCSCIKFLNVQEVREHFMKCRQLPFEIADLCALATSTLAHCKYETKS